jgi:hypothetical protein
VVANLSLNNVDDLDAVLGSVRRVLRPGGWLVVTIPHPCFETPDASSGTGPDGRPAQLVSGYVTERFWRSADPQGVRRAGNWHRTMATYLNALVEGGFLIERLLEPELSPVLRASYLRRAMCRCSWSCGRFDGHSRPA